jgi:hypothetical protein
VIGLRRIPDVRGANDVENQAVPRPTPRVDKSAGLQGVLGPDQLTKFGASNGARELCEGGESCDLQAF